MRKEAVTSTGSIVTALLAASCCIGPAIFVVFGASVGLLGRLAVLAPLRPYFLAAAAVLLGYSFWRLYLKRADCICVADLRARRLARIIFWVGAGLTVFALVFERVLSWILV
jgi:mercuric ion transport protein